MTFGAVIGVAGAKRSGKNAFAEALIEDGWLHDSFAAPIRQFACNLFDIYLDDLEAIKEEPQPTLGNRTLRQVMQQLGTEWMRAYCGEDVWVNALHARIVGDHARGRNIVISDVRFENEAKFVRSLGGIVIRIERPGYGKGDGHASEMPLPDHLIDHNVWNGYSLEHLQLTARAIARQML